MLIVIYFSLLYASSNDFDKAETPIIPTFPPSHPMLWSNPWERDPVIQGQVHPKLDLRSGQSAGQTTCSLVSSVIRQVSGHRAVSTESVSAEAVGSFPRSLTYSPPCVLASGSPHPAYVTASECQGRAGELKVGREGWGQQSELWRGRWGGVGVAYMP